MQSYITIQGVNYAPHSEEERLVFLITKIAHLEAKQGGDIPQLDLQHDYLLQQPHQMTQYHLPQTCDASVSTDPVNAPVPELSEPNLLSASKGENGKSKSTVSMKEHKQLQMEYKKLLKASKAIFRRKQIVLKLAKKHEETQMKATEKRNQTRKAAHPEFVDATYKPIIYDNLYNLFNLVKHSDLKSNVLGGVASLATKTDSEDKIDQESAEDEQSEGNSASPDADDEVDAQNHNVINVDSEETGSLGKRMPAATPVLPEQIYVERPLPILTATRLPSANLLGRRPAPLFVQTTDTDNRHSGPATSGNNMTCADCQTRNTPKLLNFERLGSFYFQHLKSLTSKPVCWCGK